MTSTTGSVSPSVTADTFDANGLSAARKGQGRASDGARRVDDGTTAKLPYTPGLSKRYPRRWMLLDDRAALIRKALQFGPLTLVELRSRMGCSRFALYKTLRSMPDVSVERQAVTVTRSVVAMRGAA